MYDNMVRNSVYSTFVARKSITAGKVQGLQNESSKENVNSDEISRLSLKHALPMISLFLKIWIFN